MSGDDGQWEVVPSYLDVLRGVYNVCHYGLYVTNGSESVSATGPHRRSWPFIPLEDVFVVLVLAVLWTLIRRLLTDRVFKVMPRPRAFACCCRSFISRRALLAARSPPIAVRASSAGLSQGEWTRPPPEIGYTPFTQGTRSPLAAAPARGAFHWAWLAFGDAHRRLRVRSQG
ncbi:hypothetical protein HPB51_026180 [Rhipicephalus microplus]|uniref:Uncharacterized protein n=1 Tax=Rhipicephalus microplus TaxID=6941 RepID=A0A9J6DRV9_RHIMP|nr:hypothetical protein HPB51_026180 [Rhipicephalus microplus]